MDLRENLNLLNVEKGVSHTQSRKKQIKTIIEALLFSTSEPLNIEKLKSIVNTAYPSSNKEIEALIEELNADYKKSENAFYIAKLAGGFCLRTIKEMRPFVELLHMNKAKEKLSKASSEVLAIVAYKEPITRAEIDNLRGVDSSGTINSLIEKELIEIVGKLEAPGRPSQYGITKRFLRHFGLKDRSELPELFARSVDTKEVSKPMLSQSTQDQ